MAPVLDPDALISSLTPTQLDALNGRLDARRAEIGRQLVYCPRCRGLGIEWRPDYGNTSSVERCSTCFGMGFVERSAAGSGASDWKPVAALTAVLENVASQQYQMSVIQNGESWDLASSQTGEKRWTAHVTVSGQRAKYRLVLKDSEHVVEGTGNLWLAIHHTSRGLPINYHR